MTDVPFSSSLPHFMHGMTLQFWPGNFVMLTCHGKRDPPRFTLTVPSDFLPTDLSDLPLAAAGCGMMVISSLILRGESEDPEPAGRRVLGSGTLKEGEGGRQVGGKWCWRNSEGKGQGRRGRSEGKGRGA